MQIHVSRALPIDVLIVDHITRGHEKTLILLCPFSNNVCDNTDIFYMASVEDGESQV